MAGDFSENYSSLIQVRCCSFTVILQKSLKKHFFSGRGSGLPLHWGKTQTSIHPWCAYYKEGGELKCISAACFSDSLIHNTAAVFAFKTKIIQYLKDQGIPIRHISYFSDGAASQYKEAFFHLVISYSGVEYIFIVIFLIRHILLLEYSLIAKAFIKSILLLEYSLIAIAFIKNISLLEYFLITIAFIRHMLLQGYYCLTFGHQIQ